MSDLGGTKPDGGVDNKPDPGYVTKLCTSDLVEDRTVYAADTLNVIEINMTVDPKAMADVDNNVLNAKALAIFTDGTFDAGAKLPNATIEVRGASTRDTKQKSFQVKLLSKTATWRGQHSLDLNKHPFDLTRVRQQLAFELFRSIPNFTSARTQFVHLVINGQDRGFYTQVEPPGNHFLSSHGLDPSGNLYKANLFGFRPIDDATAADSAKMEILIETKGAPDQAKLLRMVRDVNDSTIDINVTIDKHFNRHNYLTWLALQILLGNYDTRSQNFMLYSQSACENWYFLPWDLDGSLGWNEQPGNPPRMPWQAGLANWWDISLHQRFLSDPKNVKDLRAVMDTLRATTLSDSNVATLLAKYRSVVRPYVAMPPDLYNLPVLPGTADPAAVMAQWDAEYDRLKGVIHSKDDEYTAMYPKPMPVVLWQDAKPGLTFHWTPSFSFIGDTLTYDFVVSSSPDFAKGTIVAERDGLSVTTSPMLTLQPGMYYWHVISRGSSNPAVNSQISFIPNQMVVMP